MDSFALHPLLPVRLLRLLTSPTGNPLSEAFWSRDRVFSPNDGRARDAWRFPVACVHERMDVRSRRPCAFSRAVPGLADLRHALVRLRAYGAPAALQLLYVHRMGRLSEPREPAGRRRR